MTPPVHPALKRFIWDIQSMVELSDSEREILLIGSDLMARLIAAEDWLPAAFAAGSQDGAQQFQLYSDQGQDRFSVVSTVLGGGQVLPLFEEPVWEIMGVLRGHVALRPFTISEAGMAHDMGSSRALSAGTVERLSPKPDQAFQLANASEVDDAICIHVYGGDVGSRARHAVTADGRLEAQDIGYANSSDDPPYDIWSIQTKIED
jgi:predicted metal-dependent enzyme (double-stranded beta helix superfamily)